MLGQRSRLVLGFANAAVAVVLVGAWPFLVFMTTPVGYATPVPKHSETLMLITAAACALAIALFTWVAVIALRDRRWARGWQLVAALSVVAILAWLAFAPRDL